MMPGSARASLLLQAHSISSRQSSPRGAVASRNEKLLLFILALGAVLGLVTFWKAGDITLPAITANTALQEAPGEASLRPVLSRRMVDGALKAQAEESSPQSVLDFLEHQTRASSPSESAAAADVHQHPEAALSTDSSLLSTGDQGRLTDEALPNQQGSAVEGGPSTDATGAEDSGKKEKHVSLPGTSIIPMDPVELAEHEALIDDILENGAPSLRHRAWGSGEEQSFHLHPVKLEHNISSREFLIRYGSTFAVQPVLIRGSQSDWLYEEDWQFEAMWRHLNGFSVFNEDDEKCDEGRPERQTNECHSIKERDPSLVGKEWASLAPVNLQQLGISTYDNLFDKQVELAKTGRYLYAHEISCSRIPHLGDRLYQPRYFRNNFHDLSSANDPDSYELMQDSHFPSFFFGPRGSTSPLHSDGKKLVRLLPPAENSRASPTDENDYLPTLFTADLLHPNFETHPGLDGAIVYEALLEPGDILHIPEGWGHQALNLEWTAMVSTNYIDDQARSNVRNYLLFDEPEDKDQKLLEMYRFFLPLVNMSRDLDNIPMNEYFGSHALETAPVSDAAKAHVDRLRWIGLPPEQWHDYYSRSLLTVAIVNNYLQLAQWLVEQDMPVSNDLPHRQLLKYVEEERMQKMSVWLREEMGVPPDDDLSDIVLETQEDSDVPDEYEVQDGASEEDSAGSRR